MLHKKLSKDEYQSFTKRLDKLMKTQANLKKNTREFIMKCAGCLNSMEDDIYD